VLPFGADMFLHIVEMRDIFQDIRFCECITHFVEIGNVVEADGLRFIDIYTHI